MSKIKIAGNASGSGTLTIQAPDTSSSRTITLPDATGTLLNSDGDGSSLTGLSSFDPDGAVTINDTGAAVDFRIESDDNANMFFVDGSEDRIGIGTDVPISELSIGSTGVASYPTYSNPGSGVNQSFFASNINSGDSYNTRLDIVSAAGNTDASNGGGSISFYTQPKVDPFAPIERLRLTRDGRGLSQFTAKAWVYFNGTSTVSIGDSHNVDSITDNGTGDYNINFDVNLGSGAFSATGNSNYWGGSAHLTCVRTIGMSTSTYNLEVCDTFRRDATEISSVVFGD
jgi:hypothetical protein